LDAKCRNGLIGIKNPNKLTLRTWEEINSQMRLKFLIILIVLRKDERREKPSDGCQRVTDSTIRIGVMMMPGFWMCKVKAA